MDRKRWSMVAGLILAAAVLRMLPHSPNVAPIGALALFSGAVWARSRWALAVPLAALLLSDLGLGWASGRLFGEFHPLMPAVYGSYAASVLLGRGLRRQRTSWRIGAASVSGSTLFFLVTNFCVWAQAGWYAPTWQGLVMCYAAALPFFLNALCADLVYSTVLFGGWALRAHTAPRAEAARVPRGLATTAEY